MLYIYIAVPHVKCPHVLCLVYLYAQITTGKHTIWETLCKFRPRLYLWLQPLSSSTSTSFSSPEDKALFPISCASTYLYKYHGGRGFAQSLACKTHRMPSTRHGYRLLSQSYIPGQPHPRWAVVVSYEPTRKSVSCIRRYLCIYCFDKSSSPLLSSVSKKCLPHPQIPPSSHSSTKLS